MDGPHLSSTRTSGAAALIEAIVLAPPEEAARNAARLADEARAVQAEIRAALAAGTAA